MLARLALRLAAIEALSPYALLATGPWPTIAGPRVFDSRQDQLDGADDFEGKPLISVYTEHMEAIPYGAGRSRPDHVEVDLVCEMMVLLKGMVTIALPDGSTQTEGAVGAPATDRQHEALLDLLEATTRRTLEARQDPSPGGLLFRKVATEIRHHASVPQRDATRTVRIVARTVTFKCKVAYDQWPEPALGASAPAGLNALPEPLRTIANALPSGSSGRDLCTSLAAAIPPATSLTALQGININIGVDKQPVAGSVEIAAQVTTT